MGLLRLVILAALFYIFYRLLFGGRKLPKQPRTEEVDNNLPVQDVLVEDPVCHNYIPQSQAFKLNHKNQVYHFCSKECCKTFLSTKG